MKLKYILGLSNMVFWGMTASLTKQSILVHLLAGVVCFIMIWNFDIYSYYKKTSAVSKVIGIIAAFAALYGASGHFVRVCQKSDRILGIVSHVMTPPEKCLILLSLIAACMAILFAGIMAVCAVEYVISLIKLVWHSEFWKFFLSKLSLKGVILGGVNIISAAVIAILLMTLVYTIPVDLIEKNIYRSAEAIKDETTYPQITGLCISQLDNWTDSIMLAEAGENQTEGSALERALLVKREAIEECTPYESLIQHYVMNKPYDTQIQYPRYWHGYHVLLKPLLTFMTYPQIRLLNGIVEAILFIAVCTLFWRRKCGKYIIPWTLGYFMLMPVALAMSLQFAPCYYAYTLGSLFILMLSKEKRSQYLGIIFLNIGIFTAFFDFLTYPVIGFCISAAVYFALDSERNISVSVADLFRSGLCWCAGYAGMWVSKWVLGTVITGTDILGNAQQAIGERSAHFSKDGTEVFYVFDCIMKNIDTFFYTPIVIAVVIWAFLIIRKYKNGKVLDCVKTMELLVPYIAIGIIPFAWYLVTVNHSSIHYWFTNKTVAGLLIPAMFGFVQLKTEKSKEING